MPKTIPRTGHSRIARAFTEPMTDVISPLHRTGLTNSSLARLQKSVGTLGPAAFSTASLQRWSAAQKGTTGRLALKLVTCRIEWDRSLASPMGVSPEAAFTAVHWRWQEVLESLPGGRSRWIKLASPVMPWPTLTPGPHDATRLRVALFLVPTADARQGLEVGFANGVKWARPDGRPLRVALRPALRHFDTSTLPRALPPFVLSEAE